MEDEVLERNKSLNRGFRKLRVWREAIELYVFEKKVLSEIIDEQKAKKVYRKTLEIHKWLYQKTR